ncbi:MAG: peptidase S41 [Silicimonas sp.]|nr:peptidase S41 [Silicimonas sp.]
MNFGDDIAVIDRLVALDPSFQSVGREDLADTRSDLAKAAESDDFILNAMRLAALADNGHTRIIPNAAIKVVPARFVAIGDAIALGEAAIPGWKPGELQAVNGVAIEDILDRAQPYLAGSASRRRVIGACLASWPEALEKFGVPPGEPVYRLSDRTGEVFDLRADTQRVCGDAFYPASETGALRATPPDAPFAYARTIRGAWHLRLPSFFCNTDALERDLSAAANKVLTDANLPLVLDLRGNTGGSFLKALPLLVALCAGWNGHAAALLVDKFTFSAAIVFAALAKTRLPALVRLIGEEMGDRATFWAEGGTEVLPVTGAAFRFSTAFHDWQTGLADATTPAEIARHLVAAGPLAPDIRATRSLWDFLDGGDPPLAAALAFLGASA